MSSPSTPPSDDANTTPPRPAPSRVSDRLLTLVFVLFLAPWLVTAVLVFQTGPFQRMVASLTASANPTDPDRVFQLPRGPWGDITCTRIALGPPPEFLFTDAPKASTPRWFFKGYTPEMLRQFLNGVELTTEERVVLLNMNEWKISADGVLLEPPVETVFQLGTNARQQIYEVLRNFRENDAQHAPIILRPGLMDEHFASGGVSQATRGRLKKLLYPQEKWLLLADAYVLLGQISDPHERREFFQAVMRQWTYTAKLRVRPDSDINQLVDYWGAGGRGKDLRPLLESVARVQGGAELDVAHLLPPFARERLYTFPLPTENPVEKKHDCHWSSFNFFNEEPDETFTDLAKIAQTMMTGYEQVLFSPKMGDVVVLTSPKGDIVHSCVYIAGDLVFNKKGAHFLEPWVLIKLQDAVDLYRVVYRPDYPLTPRFFRKKQPATP